MNKHSLFSANYQISPRVGGTLNHMGAYTAYKAFWFPTAHVSEAKSSDLCHFSISAHTTLPDYNRLTHIPHTPYFTLHRGGVGGGGAPCLVPRGTVQLQARQRLLRDRLRWWSKQATYSAAMGSRGVSPRAHVAFSLFTQVKRDWGSSCKCRNTHRIYNRKAHT